MWQKQPPNWLVNHLVAEACEFSKDIDKWEYRNSYYEAPRFISCPHCDQSEESIVKLYVVTSGDGNDEFVIGQCNKCSLVYWTEVVEQ